MMTPGSVHATIVNESVSGKRHVRQIGGHKWKLTAQYPAMTRAEFAPVLAFMIAQRGQFESFQIVPPLIATPLGDVSGSAPLVDGASQTGRSLITNGWGPSKTVLAAGDFIKLANNNKVYMVTADAVSDGSGDATLSIEPALMTSPADASAITVSGVPFTMALSGDVQEFRTKEIGFFSYEVDLIEVLS